MVLFRDESLLVTDKIQAYFSNSKFKHESDYLKLDSNYIIDIQNGEFLYHTNWVRICGIYKAKGNEKFITIGNFVKFDKVRYFYNPTPSKRKVRDLHIVSYVLTDNVSLVPIKDSSKCNCAINRISVDKIQNKSILNQNNDYKMQNTILLLGNLNFERNSYKINPSSFEELDKVYKILNSNNDLKIIINGYTDSVGNAKSNQRLSEKRAKSVAKYLIDKGISQDRISYKGYGSSYPISTNETEEGRAKNRRVEVEFR
jgi:outer membrane protein OmpA-like peptidoglycan-associated protein